MLRIKKKKKELFLTTRQKPKIRNIFANNMSTNIKLSPAGISKRIQPGRFFGSWLSNLGKRTLINIDIISFARDNLVVLVSNLASSA